MSLHEKDEFEEKQHDVHVQVSDAQVVEGRFRQFYRSAFFQILVVSVLAFTGPAQADTISGLGGGGQATPWTVSASRRRSQLILTNRCRFICQLLSCGCDFVDWRTFSIKNGHQAYAGEFHLDLAVSDGKDSRCGNLSHQWQVPTLSS